MGRSPRGVNFFRDWSPEMAYVLGLWWADGYMYIKPHGAYEIEIASTDREYLELIGRVIGTILYTTKGFQKFRVL